jgi:hypothetical protein
MQRREPKPISKISIALAGRDAMAAAISNSRILQADIADCLQHQCLKITRENFGNPHCGTINIAELALELTEHGVMVTATPVAVTAQGNLSF